ncbi:esterase [Arthrobacter sp. RIT-PI-e]|uniref:glycerophosphodiester phosphodiesterase family protein n=1 Tax=Arthrobacter sp. RIT-PI-e TaxID=1681197 RepID=UPI00067661ED|nr:glycerophosphodiester phosphodiesterase family protein [Arthrobacter sp. RIT-PI-e]KNC20205.1 esterase [Arthrobacter sp. RIT-PI-e]
MTFHAGRFVHSAIAVAGLSLLTVPASTAPGRRADPEPSRPGGPVLVGHRGAAGTAPENTTAGFRDALAAGAEFFEIDVQLSADGVPFVFHDDVPARTTDVAEVFPDRADDPITSFTWAELQQLDAGSSFDARFTGERIPHLDDVADAAGNGIGVYIEGKSPVTSPGIGDLLAEQLRTDPRWQRLVAAGRVQVICFDEEFTRAFAALAPEIPLQQLTFLVPTPDILASWAGHVDSVGAFHRALTQQDVDAVHAAGLTMSVYTANSPAAVRRVVELGVDAVTTDFPIQNALGLQGGPVPAVQEREISGVTPAPAADAGSPEEAAAAECVTLRNVSEVPRDLGGYFLRTSLTAVLTIGEGQVLRPGAELRVHTGRGPDSAADCYSGLDAPVLSRAGGSIALWSPQLRLLDVFAG